MLFWTCNIFPRLIEASQDLSWGTRVFFDSCFRLSLESAAPRVRFLCQSCVDFKGKVAELTCKVGAKTLDTRMTKWHPLIEIYNYLQEANLSIRFSIQTKDAADIRILCACKFLSPLKFLKICLCQIWSTRAEQDSVSVCSGTKERRFEVGMHFIDHIWATWA